VKKMAELLSALLFGLLLTANIEQQARTRGRRGLLRTVQNLSMAAKCYAVHPQKYPLQH
jgi:hypothetical protein